MKQIDITAEIKEALTASFGEEADTSNMVVFEAIAINSLPLRKSFPAMYNKARFTPATLAQLPSIVAEESVPLQIMHDNEELPHGRVFSAKYSTDLEQVNILFAINKDQNSLKLINDINSGIIDQVSVHILPKHVFCSECSHDFLGDEATLEGLYEGVCPNGHIMGQDGAYARLSGVGKWQEVSLVNRGGAQNARIIGNKNSAWRRDDARLAASDLPRRSAVVCGFHSERQSFEGDNNMSNDFIELADKLADAKVKLAEAENKLKDYEAKLAEGELVIEKVKTLESELEELKASEDAKFKDQAELATTQLKDIATKMSVALQEGTDKIPEEVSELVEFINNKQAKLSAILPVGGVSITSESESKSALSRYDGRAFSTRGN